MIPAPTPLDRFATTIAYQGHGAEFLELGIAANDAPGKRALPGHQKLFRRRGRLSGTAASYANETLGARLRGPAAFTNGCSAGHPGKRQLPPP